jgi:hypothetical protein
VDGDWDEPETAWWAKHEHAKDHLSQLRGVCAEYRSTNPLEVRPEPTDVPGETAYRLRQTAPIPVAISLIVGDLMHCLRSSLDSLVFGIVRDSLDRDMTDVEERLCQFPICSSPKDFNKFFTKSRLQIMDDRVRCALHGVQPFYWLERMKMLSVEGTNAITYEEDSRFRPLTTIGRLSNIDKHRRLTVAAWWPRLIYWTQGKDGGGEYHWRPASAPPWSQDEIMGYMIGTGPEPTHVFHDFNLVITDATNHLTDRWTVLDLPDQANDWLVGVEVALRQMIRDYTQPPSGPTAEQPTT